MKTVRAKIHLAAAPPEVYAALATDEGRRGFWAESAIEKGGVIRFVFENGFEFAGRVREKEPDSLFAVDYFGGTEARFLLERFGTGTDLTLVESGVADEDYADQRAGWVSVLLALKAAVDFGVDLRNHAPDKRWEDGFVDV